MAKTKVADGKEKNIKHHKMTSSEKRRLVMKVAGWVMCLIMLAGVIMTFLSFFTYKN